MSDEEIKIQSDIRDHHAFEPMPYFEPSKALLKAYHRELKRELKAVEILNKRMNHLNEILSRIYDDE